MLTPSTEDRIFRMPGTQEPQARNPTSAITRPRHHTLMMVPVSPALKISAEPAARRTRPDKSDQRRTEPAIIFFGVQ